MFPLADMLVIAPPGLVVIAQNTMPSNMSASLYLKLCVAARQLPGKAPDHDLYERVIGKFDPFSCDQAGLHVGLCSNIPVCQ